MLCFKADMRKIMLTVFKHNPEAQKFFRTVMKFETDETNPYDDVYEQVISSFEYNWKPLNFITGKLLIWLHFSVPLTKHF